MMPPRARRRRSRPPPPPPHRRGEPQPGAQRPFDFRPASELPPAPPLPAPDAERAWIPPGLLPTVQIPDAIAPSASCSAPDGDAGRRLEGDELLRALGPLPRPFHQLAIAASARPPSAPSPSPLPPSPPRAPGGRRLAPGPAAGSSPRTAAPGGAPGDSGAASPVTHAYGFAPDEPPSPYPGVLGVLSPLPPMGSRPGHSRPALRVPQPFLGPHEAPGPAPALLWTAEPEPEACGAGAGPIVWVETASGPPFFLLGAAPARPSHHPRPPSAAGSAGAERAAFVELAGGEPGAGTPRGAPAPPRRPAPSPSSPSPSTTATRARPPHPRPPPPTPTAPPGPAEKRSRRTWGYKILYDVRREAAARRVRIGGRFAGIKFEQAAAAHEQAAAAAPGEAPPAMMAVHPEWSELAEWGGPGGEREASALPPLALRALAQRPPLPFNPLRTL
eukprot:tig00020830_g14402.t1